jgi:hypothetical protein
VALKAPPVAGVFDVIATSMNGACVSQYGPHQVFGRIAVAP